MIQRRWMEALVLGAVGVIASAECVGAQRHTASAAGVSSAPSHLTAEAQLARVIDARLESVPLEDAIRALSARASVMIVYRGDEVAKYKKFVTIRTAKMSLGTALEQALWATNLGVVPTHNGTITITERPGGSATTGALTGRVTDANTGRPVHGATVVVDDATRGAVTDDEGGFRLSGVSSGEHQVTVRLLGYVKQSQSVVVNDGVVTHVAFVLVQSVNALEQVVVTGTVIPTALKAVPNAITVITAKDIEQRGITKIAQLFRGEIPGLFTQNQGSYENTPLDEVTMFSRGATALSGASSGVSGAGTANVLFTNPIKTYVDGVELADPKYLNQIDPKSIERIEILTGPQASTIYGSNAINGVMQVFTKRGTSPRPRLTLNLMSGWIQNNFSPALTPEHDDGVQVEGVEGHVSYNIGGSWNSVGAWTPAKQTTRTTGFGGVRWELPTRLGHLTADATLRRALTQNARQGDPQEPFTQYRQDGWWIAVGFAGLSQPTTTELQGSTLGLALTYAPTSWWSHEFGIGQDISNRELRTPGRGYRFPSDSALQFTQNFSDRRSLRYSSTLRVPVTRFAQTTITAGADTWQMLLSSVFAHPQTLTGTLSSVSTVTRQPEHNTGAFLQTQLGLNDQLFLTYGFRAEWNPDFGANAQPNYAPRYGVAYTQAFGPVTTKLRASYGRSTRPPLPSLKRALPAATVYGATDQLITDYGAFDLYLANPDLAAEYQQGGEGGLEVYWGTRGSLVITRYNQTVNGLIALATVDSLRSLVPNPPSGSGTGLYDANGYGYVYQLAYVNVGSIRNQGWELQGSVNTGPLTTKGTYSWTKSRTIGVNPKYRAYFANEPQYQPGATFKYVPEHTWALSATYAQSQTTLALTVTGVGRVTNLFNDFYYHYVTAAIRLPYNRFRLDNGAGYVSFNSGYTTTDMTASRRMTARIEGLLHVQNLLDRYTNDFSAAYATMGRQTRLGLRVRL